MDRQHFSQLVVEAVNALPEEFAGQLNNIDVVVEDDPTTDQKRRLPAGSLLLGLYEGIPQTTRGAHYNLALPDKITIFQKPIEAVCRTDAEII